MRLPFFAPASIAENGDYLVLPFFVTASIAEIGDYFVLPFFRSRVYRREQQILFCFFDLFMIQYIKRQHDKAFYRFFVPASIAENGDYLHIHIETYVSKGKNIYKLHTHI